MQNELARLTTEVTQLRRALDSRAVIDQAQGMIMALAACPAEEAWHALVTTSQHGNTKVRDVATALVATARGDDLPPPLRGPFTRALEHARAPEPARTLERARRPGRTGDTDPGTGRGAPGVSRGSPTPA
ncbi:ANTAR domain-containing protein [Streptomyces ficellus]|uniref:ANTAR domain-containing protein n=1 Tax=Streptomyces ficellus TaxID=1977088 RepID=A0A6I6FMT1_9ACTN|nr:ANTAR domain-containing protein [Streptomyces ficellus]QGV82957.1 ANTAR domain-containing protein [Streptomyces ficellus]